MASINSLFAGAVFGTYNGPEVLVLFAGRDEYASFPARSVPLLKTDPATVAIVDAETGEVIFDRF